MFIALDNDDNRANNLPCNSPESILAAPDEYLAIVSSLNSVSSDGSMTVERSQYRVRASTAASQAYAWSFNSDDDGGGGDVDSDADDVIDIDDADADSDDIEDTVGDVVIVPASTDDDKAD